MNNRQTALAFVEAINAHNPETIMELASPGHIFIDAHGNRESRQDMMTGWPEYFEWFPDYRIDVEDVFEDGGVVVLLGFACGTYSKKQRDNHWKLPVAWKVKILDGKVQLWQVYCDSKIPYTIMGVE